MGKKKQEKFKTSIGGQALFEGVMMRGPERIALSVRRPDGEIETEYWEVKPMKWYNKVPLIRGTFNFVDSMVTGYRCMAWSMEKAGFDEEEEPSAFEKKLRAKLGDHFMKVLMAFSGILGVLLALLLFTVMPTVVAKWVGQWANIGQGRALIEGGIRIVIFVGYLWIVSKLGEIHRVFQYHGAEHKSITCYEAEETLVPERAAEQTRLHPRCGTSFLLISLIVSILLFSLLSWNSVWIRIVFKLLLLPVVFGVSYEIIRFAGRHDNILTRILSFPGMQLQRLTTAEPDRDMLEVAIASLKGAMPEKQGADHVA